MSSPLVYHTPYQPITLDLAESLGLASLFVAAVEESLGDEWDPLLPPPVNEVCAMGPAGEKFDRVVGRLWKEGIL